MASLEDKGNTSTEGRKRKVVDNDCEEDKISDRDRNSGSSSWEDQDSSDNDELQISSEPPKKKKRIKKKRSSLHIPQGNINNPDINIPEDVLMECSQLLSIDKKLDDKAKSINWSNRQVKMFLRAIVRSDEMMNMLRNAGLATGEKAPFAEPKMTRAMTKKVVEAGDVVPWIVAPATPMKEQSKEVMSLLIGDLPDDDEKDLEYVPENDMNASDDEDSLFSGGTPSSHVTENSRSSFATTPVLTPTTSSLATPEQFKRPFRSVNNSLSASRTLNFEAPPVVSTYSTRSTNPLTDYAIEDIEQQFVPFDITPDMYDIPNHENDDYSEFLKALYGGKAFEEKINSSNIDEEEDPEFVYCQNEAEERTKDPEELRNDKATKITKKEVAELMAELLECANKDKEEKEEESMKKRNVKRKKSQLPGDQIFETIREHSENKLIKKITTENVDNDTSFEVIEVTEAEKEEIGKQMEQHIQLLTQMSLLSSNSKMWTGARKQCDQMMSELLSSSLSSPQNLAGQSNLVTSMAVVKEWDVLGKETTFIVKNKNSKKYKKRNKTYYLADSLMDFMSRQSVFYYPLLLPTHGLCQDEGRISWTEGEDHLLALAMQNSIASVKKSGLTELSFALQSRYMRAKEATQIRARIKNLKLKVETDGSNPVLDYIQTGEAKPIRFEFFVVDNGTRTLVEMFLAGEGLSDFPLVWYRKCMDLSGRRNKVLPITPNPLQVSQLNDGLVVTVPDCLLATPGQKVVLVNSKGEKLVSLDTCRAQPSFLPQPLPAILCVDGTNTTPSSANSDSDTPVGLGAAIKKITRSPYKRLVPSPHVVKSPLKAASDRILKKYTTSPLKRNFRELRTKPMTILSPTQGTVRRSVPRPSTPSDIPDSSHPMSPRDLASPEAGVDMVDAVDTPTTLARRKTRHQKEAELTQTLVGPLETPEEREARAVRESQDIFDEIHRVVGDNQEMVDQFSSIMCSAGELGNTTTYHSLYSLLSERPMIQEMLLDLLSDEEAVSLGSSLYGQHQQRQRMKKFVLKLGVAYRHQPAYHARVLRELDSLCGDPNLTPDTLQTYAVKLFKHNQHLLDDFLMLIPGVEPPPSSLPSPEELQYPEDSDQSWESDEMRPETVVISRSPETVKGGAISVPHKNVS